jgi:hypothetical protein
LRFRHDVAVLTPIKRILIIAAGLLASGPALADEGGASVWLPGQFGSFAAVPGDPGVSFEVIYYTRRASAVAGTDFSRGGGLLAGLSVSEQYLYLTPTYTFEQPVLGGQLALGVTFSVGRSDSSVWGTLTGPGGNSISGGSSDSASGISDTYPIASLKWQRGDHNFMGYVMGSAPTGPYDPNRLAGVGIGHWAIDGGLGYTYMPASGFEISVTAGLTYNFVNPQTGYQSGTDGHIDIGTSWSFSDSLYVGAVAYLYNQVSADTGGGAQLGDFRSRVAGVGPQVGWSFAAGGVAFDVNLRGYKEFAAQNRPEGWNAYLTLSLSAAKKPGG